MAGQRFSGTTAREYDDHAEHSQRALFAKDREMRRLNGALRRETSSLDYIACLIRDGRQDAAWVVEQIREHLEARGIEGGEAGDAD